MNGIQNSWDGDGGSGWSGKLTQITLGHYLIIISGVLHWSVTHIKSSKHYVWWQCGLDFNMYGNWSHWLCGWFLNLTPNDGNWISLYLFHHHHHLTNPPSITLSYINHFPQLALLITSNADHWLENSNLLFKFEINFSEATPLYLLFISTLSPLSFSFLVNSFYFVGFPISTCSLVAYMAHLKSFSFSVYFYSSSFSSSPKQVGSGLIRISDG